MGKWFTAPPGKKFPVRLCLADYEEGDEKEQRLISSIISAECATAQSSRVRQPLERLDAVLHSCGEHFPHE